MEDPGFHGVFPYLVSPIDAAGHVKREVLARLVDDLITAGVHGLAPLGSTGEFAYLSWDQKRDVVAVVIEAAAGRVPVVAGVAATTTAEAVRQAQEFAAMGADGILAVLEAYFPISQEGIHSYFAGIAAAVDVPIVIYTNPNFQRSDLSVDLIAKLSGIENIRYLKDASSNTGRLLSIMERVGSDLEVFAASAHIPAAVMMIGGKGWMAGPACLVPKQSVKLYELCRVGQYHTAMELQRELWSLNQAFAKYNLAACIKGGLVAQGYEVGDPLPPQEALTEAGRADVRAILERVGAL